jgi:hypothetical protein
MSIPTSSDIPKERGVFDFTQSVARAIVYPSHYSVFKFRAMNSRKRFIYYIMQLSVRVWREANNETGHKINDFFQLRKNLLANPMLVLHPFLFSVEQLEFSETALATTTSLSKK